jgi:type II secretory pathway component PulF
MPTVTLKKNSTSTVPTKSPKVKSRSSAVSKETLALFGDVVDNSVVEEVTVPIAISKTIKKEAKTSKKVFKKEVKEILEGGSDVINDQIGKENEANLASILLGETPKKSVAIAKSIEVKKVVVSVPEKSVTKTSDGGTLKREEQNTAIVNIAKASIAVTNIKETQKSKEKSSLFTSFFSKKKSEKDTPKDAKDSVQNKVVISAPVKATPIPQRKIADQKHLSTFGLSKERDQFIENLSMLVLSGMSIVGAIASIIKQTKSAGMKLILERMLLEIESGSPVWKSFDKTKFFKGYTISLIRLGEESGNFAENLKVVSLEEEKDRDFKSKVHSALMYPIFVLGLTGIVGIGISWFILPKLAKIFYDLKLALPLITRVLLAFGLFLSKYGLIAVPLGAVIIGGLAYIAFFNSRTKFIGESIIFMIPGVKTLLMEVEVARFGYLLGTLLEAGLPVTKAIDSLAAASEVIRYRKFYIALRESVEMGNSFEKSFLAYKNIDDLIPPPVQQLIISGEQSGNLNKTLIKVGQVLEAKSDTTTKNLTIIMEPILLVIVWAGVVSVAFAVILPIYSLVGGLNNIK